MTESGPTDPWILTRSLQYAVAPESLGYRAEDVDLPAAVAAAMPLAMRALYKNHRGDVAERHFIPLAWAFKVCECHGPEPTWICDAYCLDRKALRSFSMAGFLTGWQPLVDRALRPEWAAPPRAIEPLALTPLVELNEELGRLSRKLNMGENKDPDFIRAACIAAQLQARLLDVIGLDAPQREAEAQAEDLRQQKCSRCGVARVDHHVCSSCVCTSCPPECGEFVSDARSISRQVPATKEDDAS